LVAVEIGQAADFLGLLVTTGAFAAGDLLVGNRYQAQIQADNKPFEGILLGTAPIPKKGSRNLCQDKVPALSKEKWQLSPGGSYLLTGPIPEKGSYVGETERMPSRSPSAMEREREINFSPGGSDLLTGPIPEKGLWQQQLPPHVSITPKTCWQKRNASRPKLVRVKWRGWAVPCHRIWWLPVLLQLWQQQLPRPHVPIAPKTCWQKRNVSRPKLVRVE
jgi:hypothetical protein